MSTKQEKRNTTGAPRRDWPTEERKYVRDHPEMTAPEIGRHLGRTAASVRGQRHAMGLAADAGPKWTDQEIKFITDHPEMPPKELAQHVGHPAQSCATMRKKLGIAKPSHTWTQHDTDYLVDQYGKVPMRRMAEELGCSFPTVRNHLRDLGLKGKRAARPGRDYTEGWPKEKVEAFKKEWLDRSVRSGDIRSRYGLTDYTMDALVTQLGLPSRKDRWTEWDITTLATMWKQNISAVDIAEKLGKTPNAVSRQASRMKLPRRVSGSAVRLDGTPVVRRNKTVFTEKDDDYIRSHLNESDADIGKALKKSPLLVERRRRALGLQRRKGRKPNFISPECA